MSNQNSDFVVVDDERCDLHQQSKTHCESQERTKTIRRTVEYEGYDVVKNTRLAIDTEIELIHEKRHVQKIYKTCTLYGGGHHDTDMELNKDSYLSASAAVGSVLTACDLIMTDSKKRIFCNVRPPGHHANRFLSRGFCIFNNVAVGSEYLRTKHNVKKIGIIDWDVHHGNGTESIFRNDPNIFYGSIHQYPLYPQTGTISDPSNNKYNFPLPPDSKSEEFQKKFDELLEKLKTFEPEVIFISCGFDAHRMESISSMDLSHEDYGLMTKKIRNIFGKNMKIISVLEGGYNISALEENITEHLKYLA